MAERVILCIDDEKTVLDSLKSQLKRRLGEAYSYEFAESADEGFEIIDELAEDDTEILIIVSDWLMPGMKGDEFLAKVHGKYPRIVKVMLTGQADESAIEHAKDQANLFRLINKPWDENELIEAIERGLNRNE